MAFYQSLTSAVDKLLPDGAASALRGAIRSRRDRRRKVEYELRRKTWQESAGKKEALLVSIQPDITLAAYPDSELCRLIYLGGYELQERQFVYRFLKQGDIFADVGANVGLFSLVASRAVGSAGKIFAFEPCASTYSRLLDNISRNGMSNIHAERLALSDSDGSLAISVSTDGFDAWNSAGKPTEGGQFGQETVECMTWDSFVRKENLRGKIAMAKVDIEGWEGHFLAGGTKELASADAPTILMEFNSEAAESAGTSVGNIQSQLHEFGYSLYRPEIVDDELRPFDCHNDSRRSCNVIAVKNLKHVLERIAGTPSHLRMH